MSGEMKSPAQMYRELEAERDQLRAKVERLTKDLIHAATCDSNGRTAAAMLTLNRMDLDEKDAVITALRARIEEAKDELATLKLALRPLVIRIQDELRSGRPSLVAIHWDRLEPIAKALGVNIPVNPAPLP